MTKKIKKIEIKIQNFLRKHKGVFFKQKKISKALNVTNNDYPEFKQKLKYLASQGTIQQGPRSTYCFPKESQDITGIISFSTRGFAFVKSKDNEEYFIGAYDTETAFHKDLVQIKLYKKSSGKRQEGKVIKVLERANKSVFGVLKNTGNFWEVIPESPCAPINIVLPESHPEFEENKLVEIHNLQWYSPRRNPIGEFKQIIGSPENPADDFVIIQKMFNLGEDFPANIIESAEKLKFPDIEQISKERLDLREKDIFTIDPLTAKDFDDAVSLEIIDDELMELGVHIADVSYFVEEGSELDKIAYDRAMSCYLGDKVIPMLPEKLSNDLCSLKPNVPRLAFSVIMNITKTGVIKSYKIKETIIQSKKRFTYEEAQEIIEKKSGIFHEKLEMMNQLHKILFKDRTEKGSIDFDIPEPVFKFDKNGLPIEISRSVRKDTNRLIEDFMLLANKVIATHIAVKKGENELPFIYRIHETPSEEKINNLYTTLYNLEIKVDRPQTKFSPLHMQKILEKIKGTPFANFVEQISLRSMTKAMYSSENLSHFGLAFKNYSHFTSPIRRYPDLIVHRLLKKYADKPKQQDIAYYNKKLPKMCEYCTLQEIKYVEAEREFTKIKQIRFIANKIGEEYQGIITGVLEFGMFVEIADFLIEGLVHVKTLNDDFYIYSQENHTLTGKEFGKKFRLGDQIKIKIKDVSIKERRIDFLLLD